METLTCENCSRKWKRELVRGRKPKLCPKCITVSVDSPQIKKVSMPKPSLVGSNLMSKFPAPSKWLCSSCGASVTVQVGIEYEPTHVCKKRLSKVYSLELVRF